MRETMTATVTENDQKTGPAGHGRIARVMLPKDYVRLRLTGEWATDVADASGTLLLDVARRAWSAEVLGALDLVIAPRNAVTMLAGALGVPALAIGNVGDWAECGTGQLPWFASVECINRRVDGSWTPVLGEVAARVARLAAGERPLDDLQQRKVTV